MKPDGVPILEEDAWRQNRKAQRARAILDQRHRLSQLEQAEVWAGQLTNTPSWDVFLQCLQALHDRAARELQAAEVMERGSADFSQAGMAQRMANRSCIQTRILTLNEVMNLPKNILEEGEIARELLKQAETDAA